MTFSVIIPSRKAENAVACAHAVLRNELDLPPEKIIVIDDGARAEAESQLPGVTWIPGISPFVFSRNVNLGINHAAHDDVILLNDDALLQTPRGFSAMVEASEGWGVVSTTNNCGNSCQRPTGVQGVREERQRVPSFICVYIPRMTINAVGMLDEIFIHYGSEDNDYIRRVRNAGLKVGIFEGCFVDHSTLHSTYRGRAGAAGDIGPGRRIYENKWGAGVE